MNKSFLILVLTIFSYQFVSASWINIPPEANYDFPQYITSLNHPYEQHEVLTKDGYVLTYFRIQKQFTQIQNGLPVILIHHGLLDSADSFIINDEDQAPALLLANQGYDVWLGNNRGNKYGLQHTNISMNSSDPGSPFWDFSWQEMSEYDLPAGMEYIGKQTGQIIHYMGHSEGCTIMFAALARRDPTVLQYLNQFIALAPAVYVKHSTSPLIKLGGMIHGGTILKDYDIFINRKMFGFESQKEKTLMEDLCSVALQVCVVKLRLISDFNTSIDNTERLVITQGHFPAGTSVQNLYYWQQMFLNSGFSMYDYGTQGNLERYGTSTPPEYDLSKIEEPISIFAGQYDELASPTDTGNLKNMLTGSQKVFYNLYPLGHSSFVFGKNVSGYMKDVLEILQSSDVTSGGL